jgi:hypothetical protein
MARCGSSGAALTACARDHYRFEAEQKRRARLSWLLSFLNTGSAIDAGGNCRFPCG